MELHSVTIRHNCVRQMGHSQMAQRPKSFGRGIRIRVFVILLLSLTLFAVTTSLLKVVLMAKKNNHQRVRYTYSYFMLLNPIGGMARKDSDLFQRGHLFVLRVKFKGDV